MGTLHIEAQFSKFIYDPYYGKKDTIGDFTPEHRAAVEDNYKRWFGERW